MEDTSWAGDSEYEEKASQPQSDIEGASYLQLLNDVEVNEILLASGDTESLPEIVEQQGQASTKSKKLHTTASFLHPRQADSSLAVAHRFFGELKLQDPSQCLSQEQLNKYEKLKPAISELEHRTKSPSATSFDYKEYFQNFQAQETQLWQKWGISRPKDELVPASGDFATARLAHRLHNPSFTTTTPHGGLTADPSNPCTALVMANGWSDKTIMMDHTVRREVVDPFVYYPDEVLACHEQHLTTIREQMHAPVEVVYGAPTWNRNSRYLGATLEPLDLWGDYKGVRLFLEWDSTKKVKTRKLKRFLVSAWHPQNLILPWAKNFKTAQDTLLEVAYKLASVDFNPRFFETNIWQQVMNVVPRGLIAENKPLEHQAKLAIQAVHEKLMNNGSAAVRERSKRLYTTLTSQVERSSATRDVDPATKGPSTRPPLSSSATKNSLEFYKARTDISHLIYEKDKVPSTLPPQVECLCIHCWGDSIIGQQNCTIGIDHEPRWTRTTPAKYLERRQRCQNCSTQRRLIPIENIPSISDDAFQRFMKSNGNLDKEDQLHTLQGLLSSSRSYRWQKPSEKALAASPAPKKKARTPRMIVSEHLDSGENREPVKTKCSFCHCDGPTNHHPQYIIDTDTYIARNTTSCMSDQCVDHNRHWIPRDESIGYMTKATFSKNTVIRGFSHADLCAAPKRGHRQNKETRPKKKAKHGDNTS